MFFQLADFESKVSSNSVYDEFDLIPISRLNSSTEDGRLPENTRRNRYTDVIPYDDTRVRLIPNKENLHGYINASHVKVRSSVFFSIIEINVLLLFILRYGLKIRFIRILQQNHRYHRQFTIFGE